MNSKKLELVYVLQVEQNFRRFYCKSKLSTPKSLMTCSVFESKLFTYQFSQFFKKKMRISRFNLINSVLILSLISTLCSALYEDQIGKFDW